MCGRYVTPSIREIEEYFEYLNRKSPFVDLAFHEQPSYNVAPTQAVPVARIVDGAPTLELLRWGLIPFFARGEPPKYSTINARIESFETAASYRGPWKRGQRCLQYARGFYEWHLGADGRKQPFYVHVTDQDIYAFAAIWDRSVKADGTVIESCAHITMPANELMCDIHNAGANPNRMPAILRREDHESWLSGTPDEARALLQPYPAGLMVAHPVGLRVNNSRSQGPELIEPVDVESHR
jgi:putative SOS response-associated peptidase YedK